MKVRFPPPHHVMYCQAGDHYGHSFGVTDEYPRWGQPLQNSDSTSHIHSNKQHMWAAYSCSASLESHNEVGGNKSYFYFGLSFRDIFAMCGKARMIMVFEVSDAILVIPEIPGELLHPWHMPRIPEDNYKIPP
ncbi:hypothetical protein MSAN_00760700 [Mycena sanguinolenta]|uniref:Uncharacterized protein n=1 Tax=Mycena sanguinolenta TaxID=230812 RepID=A0A8H6Z5A9_9AGAR|nr:hypothetical protein MSAN_00760700 [Mycena sanguinolenta]